MPSLDFKGKQFVYAHHLTVPFRQLNADAKKSLPAKGSKPSLDDNLIIHGDNLHALKALLPQYAGKVKCIYIDPPYNTGNEGWCYNDNVNGPLMKEWLKNSASPVDKEDLERHDKWLCMMWPRLQLLRELLTEDGSIWISIDDNEHARLKVMMDEIFTEQNFVANIVWQKKYTRSNDAKHFSDNHDHILCYAKNKELLKLNLQPRTEEQESTYSNPDNHPKGVWKATPIHAKSGVDEGFKYIFKNGVEWEPPIGTYPRFSKETLATLDANNEIWFGANGQATPARKSFLSEVKEGVTPVTLWPYDEVGSTHEANTELKEILGSGIFNNPKPSTLIQRILNLASKSDSNHIILDSFAGSGSTAHAVLALNKEDSGNRKFVLVECEDYADKITAERVRRVIKGVPSAKDESLKKGLGGHFTFCELGNEINIENLLKGENLPSYDELARYAFYTATGQTLEKVKQGADYFVGEAKDYRVHLIYKPDVGFLRSQQESAFSMPMAERIAASLKGTGKKALVFATHKFMGQKELTEMGVVFCQLPYQLHRIIGD